MPPARSRRRAPPAPRGPASRLKARLSAPPRRSEPAAIAAAFALAAVVLALSPFINAAPDAIAGRAPNFAMPTTTGSNYALSEDLGLHPVFLEFMHPDCSHCQNMGPALASAHGTWGTRVQFVTVAVRMAGFSEPTLGSVASFAAAHGHTWTYGVDQGTAARDAYAIRGTPTFVFIRADGAIARTVAGEMAPGDLEGALSALSGG